MKKIIRRILIIVLLIISIFNCTICNAQQVQNAIVGAQNFVSGNKTSIINTKALYDLLNVAYGLVMGVAIAIAIIRGIWIGITIIMGSIEQKVDAQALIIPYIWIVAAIPLGGIVLKAILKLLMNFV